MADGAARTGAAGLVRGIVGPGAESGGASRIWPKAAWFQLGGRWAPLSIVLIVYVALYGAILIYSDFLPYVLDNNESFSTINHARNLLEFDLSKSVGLTDEAISPSPEAHPFIHTHQGNMPRLFAALIYALGARSVQLQIVIVTFTVGLATVLMAFGFWRRQAGPLFAMTACLVLITDYMFFAQWQVNTYRVWIVFLVFSTLWTVLGVGGTRPWLWSLLTFLNAMLVGYGELVFAVFALSSGVLFAAWEFRRRLRLLIIWAGAAGAGALMSIAILAIQLIAYYGVGDFLTDLRYTFLTRGSTPVDASLRERVIDFYATHNIVFFRNFAPDIAERSLSGLMRAVCAHIEVVTPAIFLLAAISLLGAGFSLLVEWLQRKPSSDKTCKPSMVVAAYATLAIAATLFMFNLLAGDALFEAEGQREITTGRLVVDGLLILAFAAGCFALLSRSWANRTWLAVIRALSGALLLLLVAALLHFQPQFHPLSIAALWGDHLLLPGAGVITNIAAAACALAWTWRILLPYPGVGNAPDLLRRVAPFLLSGLLAFAIAYGFSPGYVFSGYLVRSETFLVAHLDAAIAAGFYLLIALAVETRRRRAALNLPMPLSPALRRPTLQLNAVWVLAGIGAIYLGAQWLYAQARYVRAVPPDQFAFVRLLTDDSLKGASAMSNTYAVPFAWHTGSWGYLNPTFGWDHMFSTAATRSEIGLIWLADRGINPEYRRPDLLVCYANLNLPTVASRLSGRDTGDTCRPERIFELSANKPFSYQVIGWGPTEGSLRAPWGVYRLTWPKRSLQTQELQPKLGGQGGAAPGRDR